MTHLSNYIPNFASYIKKDGMTTQVPTELTNKDGLLAQLIQILIAKARTSNRINRSCIHQ